MIRSCQARSHVRQRLRNLNMTSGGFSLLILRICLQLQSFIAKNLHISLKQMMLHKLPLASPYPFMPSHSSFFFADFETFTLCLYLSVLVSGRNDDFVTKFKYENLES